MKSNLVALGDFVEEIRQRIGAEKKTVYSVTNNRGFIPSLEVFDKQVFSADISNYKLVGYNDLAYNPSRINVGSVAICPDKNGGAVSPMYTIVRCKKELLPQYLLYFLRSEKGASEINHRAEGAVRFQFKFKDLQRTPIYLPSIPEQERIVRLLDEAEALRTIREHANRRMEQFVPALFQEMFGDPIRNPKKWEIVPVSSFVKEFQAGRSILTDGAVTENTKYWVLKVSAVTWGDYKPHESKPVPKDYHPLPNHFVKAGDLLFSRANTTELVGATVFVFDTPPNRLLSDKLWRFVWKNPDEIEPLFVWCLFQMPSVRDELGKRATGTGGSMKNISQPKVLSMPVPHPPLALQREFAARVEEARGVQSAQGKSAERIEALYQSMLSRAFAGEL